MSSPLSLSQTYIDQSIFLFRKRMQTHKEQRHSILFYGAVTSAAVLSHNFLL